VRILFDFDVFLTVDRNLSFDPEGLVVRRDIRPGQVLTVGQEVKRRHDAN
jgi:hypothetical protein